MLRCTRISLFAATFIAGFGLAVAQAQTIKVGGNFSATGPAASLGIPQANTLQVLPTKIAGHDVEYIVLDDASDPGKAVANARKLIDENNVDIIFGPSITPAAMAVVPVIGEKKVPLCAVAASASIISPVDDNKRWAFKTPQNDSLMADAIAEHMKKGGIKTAAFIGFNDAYGDNWLKEFTRAATAAGIEVVASEKFARTDTSVTGQVLKIQALKPQAVLIAGSGTPAALPEKTLKERGYTGKLYQTHGVANAEFLKVGGKDVEGTFLPVGPFVVAEQLPDSNPIKAVALGYKQRYEAKFGAGTSNSFGAHAADCGLLLEAVVPAALTKGKPGTPEFRAALRDGLETVSNITLDHGVATMAADNHNGFDTRARVMVQIVNGAWKLQP